MSNTDTDCNLKFPCQNLQFYIGIILSLCVFIPNILTIVTIWRTLKLHTNTNIFTISLAFIDLLTGISGLVQSIFYSPLLKQSSINDYIFSTITLGISYSSVVLSCTHIAIAAIDRYICITHPFYYIVNVTKASLLRKLTVIWLIGFVYLILPSFLYTGEIHHRKCILVQPPSEYYIASLVIGSLNYIIVFVCYSKIARVAFRHNKAANKRRLRVGNVSKAMRLEISYKTSMKSIKFFVVCFGTYFIFTFPPALATGLLLLSYPIPDYILYLMFGASQMHSVSNFFIHIHMCKDFSEAVKKQLKMVNACLLHTQESLDQLKKYTQHWMLLRERNIVDNGMCPLKQYS